MYIVFSKAKYVSYINIMFFFWIEDDIRSKNSFMNNVMGVPDPTFGVDVDTKSMWDLTLEQMSQAFTAELKTGYVIFYLYTELDLYIKWSRGSKVSS